MSTNVLIATSNVKFYMGISSTTNDSLIESLVPIILDDIIEYCNNCFVKSTMYIYDDQISFSTSNNTITCSDTSWEFTRFWQAGSIMRISGSKFNDGYYSLSTVASSYVYTYESIGTESSSTGKAIYLQRVEYPKDLGLIASKMIQYTLLTQASPHVQNESLGDYSYSLAIIGGNSYPENIAKALNKYRKVKPY